MTNTRKREILGWLAAIHLWAALILLLIAELA